MTPVELEDFRAQLAAMPEFATSPWFQAFFVFVMIFLIGMIINALSAVWLKKAVVPEHP